MYFRKYQDINKHNARMEKLLKKYEELNCFSKIFTLSEIEDILRNKYLAKEIVNDSTYLGLVDDPMVDVTNIVKMYEITNPKVLEKLYTVEEIETQIELASEDVIAETESELVWINIQQGNSVRIALESIDKNTVSGYTQQGESKRIAAELFVLSSKVTKEDVNLKDEWFQEYLEALVWAGYIIE